MTALEVHPDGQDGVRFAVRVAPRSARSRVAGVHGGALKVALTAPPVDGAANAALVELLSDCLRVPKSAVAILRGTRGRDKLVAVRGISVETLLAKLEGIA